MPTARSAVKPKPDSQPLATVDLALLLGLAAPSARPRPARRSG